MENQKAISQRGAQAADTVLRADFSLFFEASNDLWSLDNIEGKFPLNMAENNISWHLLQAEFEKILQNNKIPEWVSNYTSPKGSPELLASLSHFLKTHIAKCEVDPEHLLVSAGSTAILELMSWVLGDAGDVAVIPAPSYPVYTQDINNKGGIERYDLVTHHDLDGLEGRHTLSLEGLEKAKTAITASGKTFKMLILTNPDNPTGRVFSIGELDNISNWCIKNKIHLIVNEIYALSLINTEDPLIKDDYIRNVSFTSFIPMMQQKQSQYLHLVYAVSKDLGASGFRLGMFYSQNELVLKAMANLNAPHMCSNLTQWVFAKMFKKDAFLKDYIIANQKNLTASYTTVVKTLKEMKVPYVPSRGSLFCWLDLSSFLKENTAAAEERFWLKLYEEKGILLTPGHGFGHSKHGQFRLVHSYLKPDALQEAMKRLKEISNLTR